MTRLYEDLTAAPVDYLEAWEHQREVHAGVVAGGPDTVLLLEHPPVYTAGKRTEPHELPSTDSGTRYVAPVIEVDRGGKITFHGPGQLVGYPIVRLPDHVLVVDYVRRLEEALIGVCADLGVTTARVPGRSGVWLRASAGRPERKIAAIGIRVSRGVTMHGFALNCDVDLGWYDSLRAVRHQRRRRDDAQRGARPGRHRRRGAAARTQPSRPDAGVGAVRADAGLRPAARTWPGAACPRAQSPVLTPPCVRVETCPRPRRPPPRARPPATS